MDSESKELTACLEQFERAWQSGSAPELQQFLPPVGSGDSLRRRTLLELIAIDLDYRWRQWSRESTGTLIAAKENRHRRVLDSIPPSPLLEDYLKQHASELGTVDDLPVDLICEEYHVRVSCGDRPGHDEFLSRFPEQANELTSRLQMADEKSSKESKIDQSEIDTSARHDDTKLLSPKSKSPAEANRFGRYKVKKLLGSGHFGDVYLANDDQLQRSVAIKVARIDSIEKHRADMYLQEARTAAKLDHPNVVPVYDVGVTDDDRFYAVSKYIEGSDLAIKMEAEKFGVREVARLVIKIAEALQYAHTQGLIHRDIKPANILINQAGEPFVADFGLAIHEDHQHQRVGELAGTIPYMSPEQARGEAHRLDGRVDIWALGVMLYEMLTGRRPFRGDSAIALLDEIRHREAKPPRQVDDSVPRELERITLKCIAKNLPERYAAAIDLANDLEVWLASVEESDSGIHKTQNTSRSNRTGSQLWDEAIKPWDFSNYLADKRRVFTGRTWLFDKIDKWRAVGGRQRALLITGDPGTGKSAIIAQLVHLNPDDQVLAYHCCQWDVRATLQPEVFVRNLAAMIAGKLPEFAAQFEDTAGTEATSLINAASDPAAAFEQGVLAPLQRIDAPENEPRYILIDGLDESLSVSPGIVDLLTTRLHRLPSWLRVVATTRKEPEVLNRLRALPSEHVDTESTENFDDVETYIQRRLDEPNLAEALEQSVYSRREVVRAMQDKSQCNFLYLSEALDGFESGAYQLDQLDDLPPGLYGLYQTFFERYFADDNSYAPVRRVLQVVVAAREPLTEKQLAASTGLRIHDDLPVVLRRLSSYLPARKSSSGSNTYSIYHKSFADWLSSSDLKGTAYYTAPQRGHEQLADWCWIQYERDALRMSSYSLAHLPAHLTAAERWDDLAVLLCDLRFVQVKCQAGLIFSLAQDFNAVLSSLPELEQERTEEQDRIAGLRGYGDALISYAKQQDESAALPKPPALRTRANEESLPEFEAKAEQSRAGNIRAFANFVSSQSHVLRAFPEESIPIALNYAQSGIVHEQAKLLASSLSQSWLERDPRPRISAKLDCLRTFTGHTNEIRCVAMTSDGSRAISASSDETLRVWDIKTGDEEQTLRGHTGWVNSVAITPDGTLAISASSDTTVRVWNLETGKEEEMLCGHTFWANSVAITPDGRRAVSASRDKTLRVWDVKAASEEMVLAGHTNEVNAVAITPDGTRAISASVDRTLRVWNLMTGEEENVLRGHTKWVLSVAITPDGARAISGSRDKTLRVWNLETGEEEQTLRGHYGWVTSAVITPDGTRAVSASRDRTIRVWNLETESEELELTRHTDEVNSVAITPDACRAVSAGRDRTLRAWDLKVENEESYSEGHSNYVSSVAVSHDGSCAVSASRDGTLRVWDMETGREEAVLYGHASWVNAVAISPDGSLAASGSDDRTLRIWNLRTGHTEHVFEDSTMDFVNAVAFAADGARVMSAGRNRSMQLWNLTSGSLEKELQGHSSSVRSLAITSNGSLAISSSDDRTIRIWDLKTGVEENVVRPYGHPMLNDEQRHQVNSMAITPDDSRVLLGRHDHTLRVVNLEKDAEEKILKGHADSVNAVAVTSDGLRAVSASDDYTLRIWDLETGHCQAVYPATTPVTSLALHGLEQIVCGTADGQMHFLKLRNDRTT